MWCDPAMQIDPLDLPEFVVRQNGGELQGLIEGGRKAGCRVVLKSETRRVRLHFS
jgi:hypothetical protein